MVLYCLGIVGSDFRVELSLLGGAAGPREGCLLVAGEQSGGFRLG